MSKKNEHRIQSVEPGSIAEELEVEAGDVLLAVNGEEIEDVFDYHYAVNDEYLTLLIRKPDGEEWELEIEKDYEEDLGINFESSLMDDYKSCKNHCIFCFIDQMPPGMRETLYFKDDDSRLSFLQGNYVTLTNMSDHDIDRIIRYHLEPINISFHTMNPALRCQMLHNRTAGDIFPKVARLAEAGIEMNGQIVLCRGINDGAELDFSISEMAKYLPFLRSVSVVPVGLTKFRKGLAPLKPFDRESAGAVIDQIEGWQKKLYPRFGLHFIHASDEWYILAGRDFPEEERYDGYLQLENGVGMLRLLFTEVRESLEQLTDVPDEPREISIATGRLAGPYLTRILEEIQEQFPSLRYHVYEIRNDFFGELITVSGLITGIDLMQQLSKVPLGDELLLPCSMLKSDEQIFLDDYSLAQVQEALKTPIRIVESDGAAFVRAVLGLP